MIMDRSIKFQALMEGVPLKEDEKSEKPILPDNRTYEQILRSEYYQILEQPKRLPFFFHPFLSKERDVDLTGKKLLYTPHFYLKDEHNVPRRLFLNLDLQNMAFGAVGGLVIGAGTQQYFQNHGRLASLSAKKWLRGVEGGGASVLEKFAVASGITGRVVKRAATGAVLFDFLKRNADAHRDTDDWKNAAFAGGLSGAAFGLRGGLPTGIFSAAGFAACAALFNLIPETESWTD